MAPYPIVMTLYVELGVLLAGLGCVTVARMLEVGGRTSDARQDPRDEARALAFSRLGTYSGFLSGLEGPPLRGRQAARTGRRAASFFSRA